jgi:muramidase (phage lysozyme)
MVDVAAKDPLGFFNTVMTPAPKRAAAKAAPTATAPATQDLTQYANVPFSQVRDQIVSIESTNYDTIAYDRGNRNLAGVRAPQPVTTMTIGQVLDFQRNQMRPQTKGFRNSKDVGSTGVGRYQFESDTLEENAKKTFGKDFRNMQFTPETQDAVAETLWDAVKGDPKRLAKTWGAFGGKQSGAAPAAAGGVQEIAAAPQEPLAASDFYLAQPSMISRDTSNAVQMRQLLVQRANEFKKFGMIEEFDQARGELIGLDNNIRMLQGLQGITEFETARDPRRLAAVWSDYAGTPIQIQPRTDGRFDIVVNGRVTSRGVDGAQIRDVARSTFDKAYLQQRVETSAAITMEQLKSQLKVNEATATALLNSAKDIEVARINGQAGVARQLALNLQARIAQTPDGNAWLMRDGTVQRLIAEYVPPGAPEGVTPGPVALPIGGMPAGVRSVGVS